MKLKFSNQDKEAALEIFKAVASKDKETSYAAQEALAAFVGPVIDQVLNQVATSNAIFTTIKYDLSKGAPTIPIETYYGANEGLITIWSQSMPGGLASSQVWGADEYRFTTWKLFTAVNFLKKYLEESRLDVLTKGIERMSQELLFKLEYQAWTVLLTALAGATTNGADHLISATTAGTFQMDDFNRLLTAIKRLRTAWTGGTPVSTPGEGLTDMFVSPEVMEDLRAMSYQPMNTRAGSVASSGATALGLPDNMREEIWRSGGKSLFDVRIHELLEFGVGQAFNGLFDNVYTGSFTTGTQELVLGADLSLDSAIKVEGTDAGEDTTFRTEPDDQWTKRSGKVGWYAEGELGLMVADVKAFFGLIV